MSFNESNRNDRRPSEQWRGRDRQISETSPSAYHESEFLHSSKDDGETAFDIKNIAFALTRRWFLATLSGLVLMVVVASAVLLIWPVKYTVSSIVHLALTSPTILSDPQSNQVEFAAFQKAQQNLVKSRAVLMPAVVKLGGRGLSLPRQHPETVDWLQKELKTDFLLGPEAMRLSLSTESPQESEVIIEAVIESYLKEAQTREQYRRGKRLEQLQEFRRQYEHELARRRARQDELLTLAGSKDPQVFAAKYAYFIGELGDTRKRIREKQLEREDLKLQIHNAETKNPEVVSAITIEEAIRRDLRYTSLAEAEELAEEALARAAKLVVGGRAAPTLKKYRDALEKAREEKNEYRKKLIEKLSVEFADKTNRARAATLEEMQQRLVYLNQFTDLLAKEEKQLERQIESLNANQVNLESARQADSPLEKVVDQFMVEVQLLTVEMNAPPRVTKGEGPIVDWATAENKRLKVSALAALAGLVLGVGLVTLVEVRKGRVVDMQGVIRSLGLPVLGQTPRLPTRSAKRQSLSGTSQPSQTGQMIEALDITRTHLIHAAGNDSMRMILVTSAVSGEGKTTLACHLAASLARSGRRTLLVDADMRRPLLAKLFEIGPGPGFAELLLSQTSLIDALHPTAIPDLWLVPAGSRAPGVARVLAGPELGSVLTELKNRFDFVIVDAPPVLPVADALLLGAIVDGVILSVLHGTSQVYSIREAAKSLTETGAHLLGMVLNGARLGGYAYEYTPEANQT